MSEIVPKKKAPEHPGTARPRTIWAPDVFWKELQLAAKREGYSTSEFVGFLLKAGFSSYKKQRALEEP